MLSQKVIIVDRHPIARAGLQAAVHHALPGSTIVGVATLSDAEREIARPGRFWMAICDPQLPDASGLSALLRLQYMLPRVPVVLLLAEENGGLVGTARSLGAAGIVLKSSSVDEIADALKGIAGGMPVFPPHSIPSDAMPLRDRIARLSTAQRRVLFALAGGQANKGIAYDLGVTEATVKAHLTAIFRQLKVTNRVQLLTKMQPIFGEAPDQAA